jgi:hypothetical protein
MKLSIVFVISFGIVAFIYAVLAAFSTIFYRGKFESDLSHLEHKILYRKATIGDRIKIFFANLFSSYAAPPIYITAGIITLGFWIVSSAISPKNNDKDNKNASLYDSTSYFYFKDGLKVSKNELLKPCIESIKMHNGDLINAEEFCLCYFDKITKKYTSSELASFLNELKDRGRMADYFNSKISVESGLECLPANVNLNSKMNYPPNFLSALEERFKNEIQNDQNLNNLVDAKKFSNCMVQKITNLFTYPNCFKMYIQGTLYNNPSSLQARNECLKKSLNN